MLKDLLQHTRRSVFHKLNGYGFTSPVSYPSLKFAIEHIFNFNNIIILIMKDTAVPFKSSPV